MKNTLIIREGRILLQESAQYEQLLSLKVGVGTDIYRIDTLAWNQPCNRWQTTEEIKVAYLKGLPIELELYYPSKKIPKVVGEARIDMTVFSSTLEEELKIALTYDGMVKGWLYCQIGFEGQTSCQIQKKYLYLHKLTFHFLEDYENEFSLQILQNTEPIYQKKFILTQTSKTLFPNLKNTIRHSDIIKITLVSPEYKFKTIEFLVDTIKRGKTTYYQTWLRNKYNNKAGDVKIEYFLENLFLDNQRKVMSRKAVFPNGLSKMSSIISQSTTYTHKRGMTQDSYWKQELKEVQEITQEGENSKLTEQSENISKKSFKIKRNQFKATTSANDGEKVVKKNENSMPCLKTKTVISTKRLKSKGSFYFEVPFE